MDFKIKVVDLEGECFYDEDEGKQIEGVYLEYVGQSTDDVKLSPNATKCFEGLQAALSAVGKRGNGKTLVGEKEIVVSQDEWRPFAYEKIGGSNSKTNSNRFNEGMKELINQSVIERDGNYYWILK